MNILKLERELIADEGWRSKPYKCSKGFPTIGVGHKLLPHEMHLKEVSTDWIWGTLRADVMLAIRGCEMIFGRSRFQRMAEPRQRALANMVFQMGAHGVAGFDRMIQSIFQDDWLQASIHALDSKWAKKDTPVRARRVAEMLRTGVERKEIRA
jgi:lysozyme